MENQFLTFCRLCGRQILMTRCTADGRWVPCNPEIHRYKKAGGPYTYVNTDGILCYGKRDKDGEWGYQKHSMCCFLNRRAQA